MSDFYGIKPGSIPGFAEAGAGKFMSVGGLPGHTVKHMLMFMENYATCTRRTRWRSRYAYGMSLQRSRTSAGRRGKLTREGTRPHDVQPSPNRDSECFGRCPHV